MEVQEKEIEILENIYARADRVHQRDLAEIVGLSLGMTNAILKRLVQKGLLKIRKINNRNIRYIVSAKGVEAITKRSYLFFKRTIKNVVNYRQKIESLVREAKRNGVTGILLIGPSDLDFIVEHACGVIGVKFVTEEENFSGKLFRLYSERYIPDDETKKRFGTNEVEFIQCMLMDG